MLIIILFLSTIILFCVIAIQFPKRQLREIFLVSIIILSVFIVFSTEILSALRSISGETILIVWVLFLITISTIFAYQIQIKGFKRKIFFPDLSIEEIAIFSFTGIIITILFFLGLLSAPNNWDSMTYHLPRIMHWLQNHSLLFYPTSIDRQLYQAPFAEMVNLHIFGITNSDFFANSIQWFSMVGCLIGVSLIVQCLGGRSLKSQMFSVVVCITIPMGILQATTTQNDYILSFFIVCVYYFGLQYINSNNKFCFIFFCTSTALAILTKQTAFVYIIPFILYFFICIIKQFRCKNFSELIKQIGVIFLILSITIAIINCGYFIRNYEAYGDPLGSKVSGQSTGVQKITIQGTIANIVRNIGFQFHSENRSNSIIIGVLEKFFQSIHVDLNSPIYTYDNFNFQLPPIVINEDIVGNPIHILLLFLFVILILRDTLSSKKISKSFIYCVILLSTFILFSIVLKWQPWGNRLLLPFFVLSAPLIGIGISNIKNHKVISLLIVLLLCSSVPYLFLNVSKPLINKEEILPHTYYLQDHLKWDETSIQNFLSPYDKDIFSIERKNQYLINRPQIQECYSKIDLLINSYKPEKIGLVLGGDDYEYPLWIYAKNANPNVVLYHLQDSGQIAFEQFPFSYGYPDLIVSSRNQSDKISYYVKSNNPTYYCDDYFVLITDSSRVE